VGQEKKLYSVCTRCLFGHYHETLITQVRNLPY